MPVQEKTPPELEREEMSKDNLSMFLHSEELAKLFITWPNMPEINLLKTLKVSQRPWLMKLSKLPLTTLTALRSRKRMILKRVPKSTDD